MSEPGFPSASLEERAAVVMPRRLDRDPGRSPRPYVVHLFGIPSATAAIILCIVLPLLPGRYDPVAIPLSMMFQLSGKAALLLVPPGILWAVAELSGLLETRRRTIALVVLSASFLAWLVVSIAAATESATLGLGALALGSIACTLSFRHLRGRSGAVQGSSKVAPLYLAIFPTAAALILAGIAGPLTDYSRGRAIRNSAPLIADIEAYRSVRGQYPPSLTSVWPDYRPPIIGIREYRYEPQGDAYNLMFELPTLQLGVREIVMYNPTGRQSISSHAVDVLQLSATQLELDRTRGHNAARDARFPNWRYFWFD